jgi:hypothetical protein
VTAVLGTVEQPERPKAIFTADVLKWQGDTLMMRYARIVLATIGRDVTGWRVRVAGDGGRLSDPLPRRQSAMLVAEALTLQMLNAVE